MCAVERLDRHRPHVAFVPSRFILVHAPAFRPVENILIRRILVPAVPGRHRFHRAVGLAGPAGQPFHGAFRDRLGYRLRVVLVPGGLRQKEYIFVAFRTPVGHALRNAILLVPDDVLAEEPTVTPERKGKCPRNANKVFRFNS